MKGFTTWSLLLASLASATPLSPTPVRRQSSNGTACAEISKGYASAISSPNDLPLQMNGTLALECLQSMPLNQDLALQFVNETLKYIQWQSTLEVLTNPPASYLSSPTDILGGFNEIAANVTSGAYASQYDFDRAIYNLIGSANDGHLSLSLCSLGIFQFRVPGVNFVSISQNGTAEPAIYLYEEAPLAAQGDTSVSPVTQVDGQPIEQYLLSITGTLRNQDPDARYNQLFPSNALTVVEDTRAPGAIVFNDGQWPGADVRRINFRNGSSAVIGTRGYFFGNSFNSTDGQSLFEEYCLPTPANASASSASPSASSSVLPTSSAAPRAYPTPYIRDPYNQILGYDLEGDLSDTAVMFVPTFDVSSTPDNQSAVAADVATRLVNTALRNNKSRIVIDVSGNGGGDILRGFDLFKLFFPNAFPYSATRFRNHESLDLLGKVFSAVNQSASAAIGSPAWRGAVTPNLTSSFPSMAALYDGGEQLGTNVSNLHANFNFTATSNEDDPIRGYGGIRNPFSTRPFEPENIIIVGDGFCSSTCTTFVNLMTNVGGVRSVVFGGRPNSNASMQIMGGVRGAQSADWGLLDEWVQDASTVLQDHPDLLSSSQLERANQTTPIGIDNMPLVVNSASVNFRNAYQEGNGDLPLQFAYQAADCRRYYTWNNIENPASTWVAAAQAIWGNGTCVGGKGAATGTASDSPSGTGSGGAASSSSSSSQTGAAPRSSLPGSWAFVAAIALVSAML